MIHAPFIAASVLAILLAGCGLTRTACDCGRGSQAESDTRSAAAAELAASGGSVQVVPVNLASGEGGAATPVTLSLPREGLTLRDAIERCIGPLTAVAKERVANPRWESRRFHPDFAQLLRGGEFTDIPVELIVHSALGDVSLKASDIILLAPKSDVPFGPDFDRQARRLGAKFSIRGQLAPPVRELTTTPRLLFVRDLYDSTRLPNVPLSANILAIHRKFNSQSHRVLVPYIRRERAAESTVLDDAFWGKLDLTAPDDAWILEYGTGAIHDGDVIEFGDVAQSGP